MLLPLLLGLAAAGATYLGGSFALKATDKLHLILGFSAGAVVGVALFDLLPEALRLSSARHTAMDVTSVVAAGFFFFMILSRIVLLHPHAEDDHCEDATHVGKLGALSLSLHSFLDGIAIGLGFQVSTSVGAILAAAVLTHDFSDGINTVSVILKHEQNKRSAFRWLLLDAIAPFLGVLSTVFFRIPSSALGLLLGVFCGFFLYIGASDLLPESHHGHPKTVTSAMTVLGAGVIYIAIRAAGG